MFDVRQSVAVCVKAAQSAYIEASAADSDSETLDDGISVISGCASLTKTQTEAEKSSKGRKKVKE